MSELQKQLDKVSANLERLVRAFKAIQEDNRLLKTQVETLRQQVSDKTEKMKTLQDELEVIRTAKVIESADQDAGEQTEAQKEVRQKINEYIREIDNCIRKLQH
jgi:predicted  nucleic acid-binding Zn-ribbon protein